jgi:hypothetical protein
MVIVLAAIMAAVAFVVLIRLLWLSKRPTRSTAVITLAAVALVAGLALLAASGRMHWLAAVGAAILPFLKRAGSLFRYLPLFRGLFGGLDPNPSREDVIAAHRRLMQKVHPDRGGSTYLAQQLNEAKRVLLKHGG